jgi:hypothetical protein
MRWRLFAFFLGATALSESPFSKSIPRGKLVEIVERIEDSFPRPTPYQRLFGRIASLALRLPIPDDDARCTHKGMRLRRLDKPIPYLVEEWALHAARIEAPAGMAVLDATVFLFECLEFLGTSTPEAFPGSTCKRSFTDTIKGVTFSFRVPVGFELDVAGKPFGEGCYGVGRILRCHLSESSTHIDYTTSRSLYSGRAEDFGYFGVPCEIAG